MHIYRADLRDLAACLALDGSYETERVWQLSQNEGPAEIQAQFRLVNLPRRTRVAYPSWGEALLAHQQRGDLILVAAAASEVRGYIDVQYQPEQGLAWIHHLIVAPAARRCGTGNALVNRAMSDARAQGFANCLTVVQSKNAPAIEFLQRNGFAFCGYNERYYRNQDIGLFFACGL
jgi:ribosomal protein S18 acetylase RimI-like enzyme